MAYVIGIDGGGTKTQGILCDDLGKQKYSYTGGPTNHEFLPAEEVQKNMREVLENLLLRAQLSEDEISFVHIGIAGCDSLQDEKRLTEIFLPVFGRIPYRIENDVWIAMACVPSVSWGGVAVCGTEFNFALQDPEGRRHTLRALRYEQGNLPATKMLIREALHYGFRSEEHTGPKTELEIRIPWLCGVKDIEGVLSRMQEEPEKVYENGKIAKEIFLLAREGDKVCQDILISFGNSMGEIMGNFIRYTLPDAKRPLVRSTLDAGCLDGYTLSDGNTGMDQQELSIVLSGSMFVKAASLLHLDAMTLALRKYVPDFQLIQNRAVPAEGACVKALQAAGFSVPSSFFDTSC